MKTLNNAITRVSSGAAAEWAATNGSIPKGLLCVETDTGRAKVGDGVSTWAGLSYAFNNLTDAVLGYLASTDAADGFLLADTDGLVPLERFPAEARNTPVFVTDIAARDALSTEQKSSVVVIVADASADPLISTGMAWYIWDATNEVWRLLHKQGPIVLEFPEEIMPVTATLDAFADGVVHGRISNTQYDQIEVILAETDVLDLVPSGPEAWTMLTPMWNSSADLGAANGGQPYECILSATDPYNNELSFAALDELPHGLELVDNIISGVPTNNPGTYTFTIRVSNIYDYADRTFTLAITNSTPIWTTAAGALPAAMLSTAYTTTLIATDPNNDLITYSVESGTIPPGVVLSEATLVGTPTTAGTYNFTIAATDPLGASVSRAFTIVVQQNNTIALFHFDGNLTDSSKNMLTATGANLTYIPGGIRLDTNSYVSIPHTPEMTFGMGDWTLEIIFSQSNITNATIFCSDSAGYFGWQLWNADVFLYYDTTASPTASISHARSSGTRYHYAMQRRGTEVSMYINGVRVYQRTNFTGQSQVHPSSVFRLGFIPGYPSRAFVGDIFELKMSNAALYSGASFTPVDLAAQLPK